MEDRMSFVLKPTLQHMAMAKIAIEMWIQDDVMALMPETDRSYYPQLKDEMEVIMKLREKVRNLQLPGLISDMFWTFIKPVGTQIRLWNCYLRGKFSLEGINPKNICWTSYGTIDQKQSVVAILQDQRFDVFERVRLACTFCLMDKINDVMDELPEEREVRFEDIVRNAMPWKQELVIFWAFYMTDDLASLNEYNAAYIGLNNYSTSALFAFQAALFSFNSVAAQYLFKNMMQPAEKKTAVFYTQQVLKSFFIDCEYDFHFLYYEFFPDLLCFLLSRMNRKHQRKIFQKCPEKVLQSFLVWPYQSLFVDTAKRMWTFISERNFNTLLFDIFRKIDYGSKVCAYRDIFSQFWNLSSVEYRKYVIDWSFWDNLEYILEKGEFKICRMILAALDASEKDKLVADKYQAYYAFYAEVIKDEKWDMLKFFLKECAPSAEALAKVKNLITENRLIEAYANQKIEFYRIVDSFIPDQQK